MHSWHSKHLAWGQYLKVWAQYVVMQILWYLPKQISQWSQPSFFLQSSWLSKRDVLKLTVPGYNTRLVYHIQFNLLDCLMKQKHNFQFIPYSCPVNSFQYAHSFKETWVEMRASWRTWFVIQQAVSDCTGSSGKRLSHKKTKQKKILHYFLNTTSSTIQHIFGGNCEPQLYCAQIHGEVIIIFFFFILF